MELKRPRVNTLAFTHGWEHSTITSEFEVIQMFLLLPCELVSLIESALTLSVGKPSDCEIVRVRVGKSRPDTETDADCAETSSKSYHNRD